MEEMTQAEKNEKYFTSEKYIDLLHTCFMLKRDEGKGIDNNQKDTIMKIQSALADAHSLYITAIFADDVEAGSQIMLTCETIYKEAKKSIESISATYTFNKTW